jgi:hypothetical protein
MPITAQFAIDWNLHFSRLLLTTKADEKVIAPASIG